MTDAARTDDGMLIEVCDECGARYRSALTKKERGYCNCLPIPWRRQCRLLTKKELMIEEWPTDPNLISFSTMGKEGDVKQTWNRKNQAEVAAAKELFEKLIGDGYRAYLMNKNGSKGEPVETFDAKYERILFVPPFQGG